MKMGQNHQAAITTYFSTEYVAAWISFFFISFFSAWTIAHHVATFFNVSWEKIVSSFSIGMPFVLVFSAFISAKFATTYRKETNNSMPIIGLLRCNGTFVLLATILLVLFYFLERYSDRFFVSIVGMAISAYYFSAPSIQHLPPPGTKNKVLLFLEKYDILLIILFVLIAVAVTLAVNRPDFDDAEYLQTALQTLANQDKAPLTFDTSLGVVLDSFRFSPQRIASYETFVALLAQWTGISVLDIYYIFLPAVTAVLTISIGYLFSRWFLPPGVAVLATGLFLLIMLSWGETHVAYGNRVFVRLFQGKGLLIALTTPLSLVAGLLLIRSLSFKTWFFLFVVQVSALGVSSTGLVVSCVTTLLLLTIALSRFNHRYLLTCMAIASTLGYALLIGAWLKYSSSAVPSIEQIGTYLPINASFGLGAREAIALTAMVFGLQIFGPSDARREFSLLVTASILVVLNPWFSEFIANHSAKNMVWRTAWATPIPLILSIIFSGALAQIGATNTPRSDHRVQRYFTFAGFIGVVLPVLFLQIGQWTISPNNNVRWAWASIKTPEEYYEAKDISEVIKNLDTHGSVLADDRIGTWLTVVAPDLKLVMPGHGYPIGLQTLLPKSEFDERMQLLSAVDGAAVDLASTVELMMYYKVSTLVVQRGPSTDNFIGYLLSRTDMKIMEIPSIAKHRIFVLSYNIANGVCQ